VEKLRKLESGLIRAEEGLICLVLGTMVCLSFAQVVLRQFFGLGLLWGDTFLRHIVLWAGFLGAARAMVEEKHFGFELLHDRLGPRAKNASRLATSAACAALAWAACRFVLDEKSSGAHLFTVGSFQAPAWVFAVIVPLGFILVGLHSLLRVGSEAKHP
jgi:TRAP-type C4-dicarboxylate transport system permease small subunit